MGFLDHGKTHGHGGNTNWLEQTRERCSKPFAQPPKGHQQWGKCFQEHTHASSHTPKGSQWG